MAHREVFHFGVGGHVPLELADLALHDQQIAAQVTEQQRSGEILREAVSALVPPAAKAVVEALPDARPPTAETGARHRSSASGLPTGAAGSIVTRKAHEASPHPSLVLGRGIGVTM